MPVLPRVKRFVSTSGVRIYQVPCQVFPQFSGRVYLLLGAGPPTLVDAGSDWERCTRDILQGLQTVHDQWGEPIDRHGLQRIIITHAHLDHFGGLAALLRESKAEVAIHSLGCRAIVAYDEYAAVTCRRLDDFLQESGVEPSRRRALLEAFGMRSGRFPSVPVDLELSDGQDLDGLRIIHAPGHASGLVCVGVDNILLTSDHILATTIPQQWPEGLGAYVGLGHYLDSLDKVQRMDGFDLALGGHEMAIHDISHRIDLIRAGLFRRLDRLQELLRTAGRPLSVGEITGKLYGDGADFRAVLQATDVAARVEYLHQRGKLLVANLEEIRQHERPVYRYAARFGDPGPS